MTLWIRTDLFKGKLLILNQSGFQKRNNFSNDDYKNCENVQFIFNFHRRTSNGNNRTLKRNDEDEEKELKDSWLYLDSLAFLGFLELIKNEIPMTIGELACHLSSVVRYISGYSKLKINWLNISINSFQVWWLFLSCEIWI